MPSFSEFLFGSNDKLKKVPTGTSQQQQFGNQLIGLLQQMMQPQGGYGQAQQYHQNILGGGPQAFQDFAEPYLQQFQEQIAPRIAEQFAGMGALSSSGFGQALGGAGAGLQSQLAQLFSQLQQQSAGQQYGQFNTLGQLGLGYQPFAYQNKKGSQGFLGPLAGSAFQALGAGFL